MEKYSSELWHYTGLCHRKIIKSLVKRERLRQSFWKLHTLLRGTSSGGLNKYDIPDPRAPGNEAFGDPKDPKSCKGPWLTLTAPKEIAKLVCTMNVAQYHQAHNTLFWLRTTSITYRPPWWYTNWHSTSYWYDTYMLNGMTIMLHPILMTRLPSLQIHLFHTYRNIKENSSSSLSGHHMGHYKAVLQDPVLINFYATMMN